MSGPRFVAVVRGRVWKLGDSVDTDVLAPFATISSPWEERKATLLPDRRDLVEGARPGDILVAGENFGCGSSREPAPENLRRLGFAAVLAESFARIYFRNCIAIGFPNLPCPGITAACEEGDRLEVDIESGRVLNHTRRTALQARRFTPAMLEILRAGGLLEQLVRRAHRQEAT